MRVISVPVTISWYLLVLSIISIALAQDEAIKRIPHFLLSGQSNMEGTVDDFSSLNGTLETLFFSDDDINVHGKLLQRFLKAESSPATPQEVYDFMAYELLRLKHAGVLRSNFEEALEGKVQCSFYQMYESVDYRKEGESANELAVDRALSPYSNCGIPFGPELMFGHVLSQAFYSERPFSIVKVASGGSTLKKFWSKEDGFGWGELRKQIRNFDPTQGDQYKAFVWFQGESDSFDNENQDNYLKDLTHFMADVRFEMYAADPSSFLSPADIPVVIIGMGCWIAKNVPGGAIVIQAQEDFVAKDWNAILVPTDDLSCHYHYDDVSQVIIGYRLAEAMKELLLEQLVVEPASPAPSTVPSTAPIHLIGSNIFEEYKEPLWVYEDPEWWDTVVDEYGSKLVKQCKWKQFPPKMGSLCPRKKRYCFWGNQECGGEGVGVITAYPTIVCRCSRRNAFRGVWACEYAECPLLPTDEANRRSNAQIDFNRQK